MLGYQTPGEYAKGKKWEGAVNGKDYRHCTLAIKKRSMVGLHLLKNKELR